MKKNNHIRLTNTRHSRLLQASERYYQKNSDQLFPLNKYYEIKLVAFNKAYIWFIINPTIPVLSRPLSS